jgi:hypothetical protein
MPLTPILNGDCLGATHPIHRHLADAWAQLQRRRYLNDGNSISRPVNAGGCRRRLSQTQRTIALATIVSNTFLVARGWKIAVESDVISCRRTDSWEANRQVA